MQGSFLPSPPLYPKYLIYWGYRLKIQCFVFFFLSCEEDFYFGVHPKHLTEWGKVEQEDQDLLKMEYKKGKEMEINVSFWQSKSDFSLHLNLALFYLEKYVKINLAPLEGNEDQTWQNQQEKAMEPNPTLPFLAPENNGKKVKVKSHSSRCVS